MQQAPGDALVVGRLPAARAPRLRERLSPLPCGDAWSILQSFAHA
jgi:hypothetical protein